MAGTWRDRARPIIAAAIAEVGKDDMKRLRKVLRERYPFGMKKYWPYKVWLDEIKRQTTSRRYAQPGDRRSPVPLPGQQELF